MTGLPPDVVLVDTPAAWHDAATRYRCASRVALDVEADGFHRYPERVSLLQLRADGGPVHIVDPIAVERLDDLGEVLEDPGVEVVLHAGAFDLRSMDRDHGFRVHSLFDTSLAAQFCGARRTGLANVLSDFVRVDLDKPKRYQRHDWSVRPLKPGAIAYAAGDVRHLLPLASELKGHLRRLDRLPWVEEECARLEEVRYEEPAPPEESWTSIRGARELSARGRAALRELNVFREAEARRAGRPPYRILTNRLLLRLASAPSTDLASISALNGRRRTALREGVRQALARAEASGPQPWPRRPGNGRWSRTTRDRLKALKRWRSRHASELDLDAGIVWPAAHLKAIAAHETCDSRELDAPRQSVRQWQWEQLGDALERFRREHLGDVVERSSAV